MWSTLRLGFNSLLLHKLRSGLAILGILIGVTAVIWLVALGEGVSYQAQQQIKDLGATNIIVRSVKPPLDSSKSAGSFYVEYGLLREDFRRIRSNLPSLKQVVPMREINKEVRTSERSLDARLVGCTTDYLTMNHLKMHKGRFISDNDEVHSENVVVLADGAALKLFLNRDPLGETVQIGSDFYRVIGITANRIPSAAIGGSLAAQDFNYDVYIPLATFRWRIGDMVITARSGSREGEIVELSQITVTVSDLDQVDETAEIIDSLLKRYHRTADYAIVVPKELLRQAEMIRLLFNVLLVVIAGISLVVGGIGIMNIMLATVTERTREIGIRRALGAKRRDITWQFLTETIVLSGTGGLLGVGFGYLCGPVVTLLRTAMNFFVPETMRLLPQNIQELEPRIMPISVIAAFCISVGVGVLFGLYPALRAAYMDPIEALRHE